MTLKIMNRISHAPPRCEPEKRDARPSFLGEFLIRMIAKDARPTTQAMAMKSWRKPRTGQVPTIGMWKSGFPVTAPCTSAPYASR